MKNLATPTMFISSALFLMVIGTGCGSKLNGNYALTQSGGAAQTNPACSAINLVLTENNNVVSGTAGNGCYNETLNGTNLGNGTMNVTVNLTPVYGANAYPAAQSTCNYQGTMTISGNLVTGTLMAVQSVGISTLSCGTQLTINGTKN